MIIRKAEFVTSAVKPGQYPPPVLPEIAVCGRSNVGKSSLINKLLRRKQLARVGKAPGKTRLINFFNVNDEWYLVDLPGYGFAKVSKDMQKNWGIMMKAYFAQRRNLLGAVLLVDIRRTPAEADVQMAEMLAASGRSLLVVATKVDKVGRGELKKQMRVIAAALALDDPELILPFSASDGTGVEELSEEIEALLTHVSENISQEVVVATEIEIENKGEAAGGEKLLTAGDLPENVEVGG
jgi:GTP-binding protein